jgi:plasmid stability protein
LSDRLNSNFDIKPYLWKIFWVKTTLDLPDNLMREMKIRAATQGKKLTVIITEALRESLASKREVTSDSPPLVISRSASGLPYIKCKPSSAKSVPTIEELQRLIDESQLEEDLQRAGISH